MVICLEHSADLHMAQLMPLPLTVSCFSKIQIGFIFLVPADPGSSGQRAVKRVCVCVVYCNKNWCEKSRSTGNMSTQLPRNATPYKRPAAATKAVSVSLRRHLSSAYWHETVDNIGVSQLDKTQLDRQEVVIKTLRGHL